MCPEPAPYVPTLTIATGSIETNAQNNKTIPSLPSLSYHLTAEEAIEARARGGNGITHSKARESDRTVVEDISKGRPGTFWHGSNAKVLRIMRFITSVGMQVKAAG